MWLLNDWTKGDERVLDRREAENGWTEDRRVHMERGKSLDT